MISTKSETEHGTITHAAEIQHSDGGNTIIKIKSQLGAFSHQHSITVGSEDSAKDLTSTQDDDVLLAGLQKHLDAARKTATEILGNRARIQKLARQLV